MGRFWSKVWTASLMLEQLCPSAGPTFVFAVCRMYWAGVGSLFSSTEQAPVQCFLSAGAGHLCGIDAASAQRLRRWSALYGCCADVLSYDVIIFNEHNKNYAYFYFIMYAYFNLINFIMYRPYVFFILITCLVITRPIVLNILSIKKKKKSISEIPFLNTFVVDMITLLFIDRHTSVIL